MQTKTDPDALGQIEAAFHKSEWPYYWITRVNARYVLAVEKALRPIGLDVPRWRVLSSLTEDAYLSISEISDFCIIRLNTTTKIIQRMTTDGLVTVRSRKADARVTEVTLTEEGRAQARRARVLVEAVFQCSFADIGSEELAQMNSLLKRVFDRLGEG